jgi:glycosyltransferase involved in cell wall biosynthesis
VIPAFNAADSIGDQLDALFTQEPGFAFEVVVSDNGSTDTTRSIVEGLRGDHEVRLVDASDRPGAAYARNRGAASALGKYLLFCDSDDIVGDCWIRAIVEALETADVVGGYLDYRALNNADVVAWRGEGPRDRLPGTVFLPAGYSANMGTTRAVFEALGGFGLEFTGAAGEDLDFFWRAQLAGYSAAFAPGAVVQYRLRDDLRANARQAFFYGHSLPQLYRLHRADGMRRRPLRLSLRQAAWVVVHSPDWFRGPARRGKLVWSASNLLGRVVGAVRFRVASV